MRMNRAALPAAVLAGGLLAGCSAETSNQPSQEPIPSVISPTAGTPAPRTTAAPVMPMDSEPSFINVGKDKEGDAIVITALDKQEQAFYDRFGNPAAASQAAIQLGCNAISLIRSDWNKGSDEGTPLTHDYDLYQQARSVYDFSQYKMGTLKTEGQFADDLSVLGCIMPERPSEG